VDIKYILWVFSFSYAKTNQDFLTMLDESVRQQKTLINTSIMFGLEDNDEKSTLSIKIK
jgi:hypothetical protein